MIELIPLFTAILKVCIALRVLTFTSTHHRIKPIYSILAVGFVGYFLGSAVSILVNGQLVTLSELILTVILTVLVMIAQGNVAELFRKVSDKSGY
ncbi:phage holin family protein [Acinetobacter variabilis]|uniref:Uncharacterized protein n=1 Tax=Acinetobacter variabilis TaxID=70346 RepID=N8WTZ3_9GAMM|nr:phage holin family protein [Acinetobacter variabilis]ENV00364.1 hypothetical protein F969_00595 [Acinetobacter variabilis]